MAEFVPDRIDYSAGQGENSGNQHFLTLFVCSKGLCFRSLKQCEILQFNPFPNKPCFICICSTSLLKKHCGKRRNCS